MTRKSSKKCPNSNTKKVDEKSSVDVKKHSFDCALLSEIFSENFPDHFGSGFVHLDSDKCFNNIIVTVVKKAVEDYKSTEEIINQCKMVNDIYDQFKQTNANKVANPFLESIQNYARSLFENLKMKKVINAEIACNSINVLALLYNNEILTAGMMKSCLGTFLKLAETEIYPFFEYFCKLLSQISLKLSKSQAGKALLELSTNHLYTFISSRQLSFQQLPSNILTLLKGPIQNVSSQEKSKTMIKNNKFDSFLEFLQIFKNQVNSSLHCEEFYTIMTRGLIDWQSYLMREDEIDIDILRELCKTEMFVLRDNVEIFRRRYDLKLTEDNKIIIEETDFNILLKSYQIRNRVLDSTKYISQLYNIHKFDERFIVDVLQFMISYDVVSNVSLECACRLLFAIMPKFIAYEYGPEILKYMVNTIQTIVKTAQCTARVKFLLIDLISNTNKYFPFMHIQNIICSNQNIVKFPLRVTLNTAAPLW
ncbi:hypothetical protein PVAND_011803 [Polypedilum vanderplanki]|uniref:Uncharacterized protein n=1 Tax=Polypedilum vanderplanki TaxID=319348 RepID=A0A9J6CKE6_POLVA|nr:hypothetical protein PVAND_011803 [Polypedilum vanderplanki]